MVQRRAIFITGGGSGIGRAIAQRFAAEGWFVGLGDIDQGGMAETERLIAMLPDTAIEIGIGDLVLMELLQGVKDTQEAQRVEVRMTAFSHVMVCDRPLVVKAASNFRFLRSRGITIRKTIDTLIATRCIVDDYALLYSDRDFDPFVEHLGLRSAMA